MGDFWTNINLVHDFIFQLIGSLVVGHKGWYWQPRKLICQINDLLHLSYFSLALLNQMFV